MSKTMKAAVFEGEGKLTLKDVPVPQLEHAHDVLLKVEAASICGTDVHILHVPPGHPATAGAILGHEYLGSVLECGSAVKHIKPGDRVAVDPNLTCGLCASCRLGMPNMCENMTTLGIFIDGGFAEYNVAPAKALHKISNEMPVETAIFAEPLSCVINGNAKVRLLPGENVVILGAGPIGLLYTGLLKLNGAGKVIVVEVNPFRAGKAREMGADIVINPKEQNVKECVMDATGFGADVTVDAVGSLLPDAIDVTRRGGRVLLFGMNSNAQYEFKQFDITRREITVIGTYISNNSFPPVLRLLESGRLNLAPLVTHKLKLDQLTEGIEIMRRGDGIEIIVTP